MRLESDEAIAQLLVQVKRIALIGASAKPERPSHRVMQFLLDEGYEVLPINPGLVGQRLLGQTVYASLANLPTSVDMADIFRDAASLQEVAQDVVAVDGQGQIGDADHRARFTGAGDLATGAGFPRYLPAVVRHGSSIVQSHPDWHH